jgi:hypothetical protein
MASAIRISVPLQTTLDNLAYLSAVQNNEKYFFSERTYIKSGEWTMTRVRRYMKNETLNHQLPIIRTIIDAALDCFKIYRHDCHFPRLLALFHKARDGLSNVRNTYTLEGINVTDIETILYMMNTQLEQVTPEEMKTAGISNGSAAN